MEVKNKLTASFKKIRNISVPQLLEMHNIFNQYYHNADLKTFVTDMGAKTGVIILQDKREKRMVAEKSTARSFIVCNISCYDFFLMKMGC